MTRLEQDVLFVRLMAFASPRARDGDRRNAEKYAHAVLGIFEAGVRHSRQQKLELLVVTHQYLNAPTRRVPMRIRVELTLRRVAAIALSRLADRMPTP